MPDIPPDSPRSQPIPTWAPPLFYLFLSALFLWRSLFTGEVFLPAGLLGHVAPYSVKIPADHLPPWNPLRWDGVAQFYPWRHFASLSLHSGLLPLWNPYQFCGTPFVANSQSAVFYPGNLLFYLLPTAQAFGFSALLHLTLCGWFTYLLLRRLRCTHTAALLGGIVFAYSAWQVAWLQLPTFLATSCWFPLLLRQLHRAIVGDDRRNPLFALPPLAAVVGCMLLAGHLQIAFYGLLAGTLWAIALLTHRARKEGIKTIVPGLGVSIAGLAMGLMLCAPQLLPSIELSRRSHRVSTPTASGYAAYTEYALPTPMLATLMLPDFFGNDADPNNPYWGFYTKRFSDGAALAIRHNAAETALYVGIAPLLLALLALLRGLWPGKRDGAVLFFGGLALLTLLLALGTPVNALFYFGIPGFGQSGSPARSLVLWAFSIAVLSAFGLDRLRSSAPSQRERLLLPGGLVLLLAVGLSLAAQSISRTLPRFQDLGVPLLGDAVGRIGVDWARLALMTAGSIGLLLPAARRLISPTEQAATTGFPSLLRRLPLLAPAALLLTLLDLFSVGIGANPTAPPSWVYPETEGVRFIREHLGHDRLFPVNQRWSLYKAPPVVMPPNGATAYGFRDVQGYDSLLTGRYKAFADQLARPNPLGAKDASPPEVGNMIFLQDPTAPLAPQTGASLVATLPTDSADFGATIAPSGSPVYQGAGEMALYAMPDAMPRARLISPQTNRAGSGDGSLKGRLIGQVRYLDDGPTRVSLDLDAPVAGTLVLADQLYPGWQATIDRKPAVFDLNSPLACGVYRALSIAPGRHRIDFRYDPASFRVGLYLSFFACLLLGSLAAAGRLSNRQIK